MTAGYELAAVQRREFGDESWETLIPTEGRTLGWIVESVIEDVLASPVLARVIREAKAEAWGEGQAGGYICAQGYHAHGDGHGPDSWDCDCPNPHRDQTEEPT